MEDVTSLVLSYIIKIWFVIDLMILVIGIYCKSENETFVKKSNCLKEYENIKNNYQKKYKKLNLCMKISIILMISMLAIFVIAIVRLVFSLGGILYLGAGESFYNFINFAFHAPFISVILFDLYIALFSCKLICMHINIKKELKILLETHHKE